MKYFWWYTVVSLTFNLISGGTLVVLLTFNPILVEPSGTLAPCWYPAQYHYFYSTFHDPYILFCYLCTA